MMGIIAALDTRWILTAETVALDPSLVGFYGLIFSDFFIEI